MGADWPGSLLLVGCGNMGGAMLRGWLASGFAPERFTIVDPVLDAAPEGVALHRALPQGAFDAVLLGIKPQMLASVAPTLAPVVSPDTIVLSILAGVELETLAAAFPAAGGHVRIMPNLAAQIGKSPVALAERGLDERQRAAITGLMDMLGTAEWVGEDVFDLITALAGSGPAFVYRFIDALAAAAEQLGLDKAQAQRLALATVEGAALLAAASEHSPGELADRVASPGGVTREGLNVLDEGDALAGLVAATLRAARDRSAEMAREAKS